MWFTIDFGSILDWLNFFVVSVSVVFIWITVSQTNAWNRKKGSQEILDKFVHGEIPDLKKKIRIDFNCDIHDKKHDYSSFAANLEKNETAEFEDTVLRILNIFEVIAINMKNSIIIEHICFDYLGWIYTEYYTFSKSLILEKRKLANDDRVFCDFEKYAIKWQKKIDEYNKNKRITESKNMRLPQLEPETIKRLKDSQ